MLICNNVNQLIPALQAAACGSGTARAAGERLPPRGPRRLPGGAAQRRPEQRGRQRRALNSLQTVFNMGGRRSPETVSAVVGVPMAEHVRQLLEIARRSPSTDAALRASRELMKERGIALQSMLGEVFGAVLRSGGGAGRGDQHAGPSSAA